MKIEALKRINADVGGVVVHARRGELVDVAEGVAKYLIENGSAAPVDPGVLTEAVAEMIADVAGGAVAGSRRPTWGQVLARYRNARKAILGPAAALGAAFLADLLLELSRSGDLLVATVASVLVTYLVPNKEMEG